MDISLNVCSHNTEEGGTEEKETTTADADKCTMSNELAMKLGQVAILLENSYGGPRDLEWAVSDGTVYLLQVNYDNSIRK